MKKAINFRNIYFFTQNKITQIFKADEFLVTAHIYLIFDGKIN